MSEVEFENVDMAIEEKSVEEKPKKVKKARKPMSEERKAKLREQLKKGRETALKNRQKKAKLKQIDREQKSIEEDKKIAEYYSKKVKSNNDNDNELQSLKEIMEKQKTELEELRKFKNEQNIKIEKEVLPTKILKSTKDYTEKHPKEYKEKVESMKPKLLLDENRRIIEVPGEEYRKFLNYQSKQKQLKYQQSRLNNEPLVLKDEKPKKYNDVNKSQVSIPRSKPIPIPKEPVRKPKIAFIQPS
jgi:hypothetical protein